MNLTVANQVLPAAAVQRRIDAYRASAGAGDMLSSARGAAAEAWQILLGELARVHGDDLAAAEDQVRRRVEEMGVAFRLPGEVEERRWPVSPVPLMIDESEWNGIAGAVAQRAQLCEALLADIYGPQSLVASGDLPPGLLTGSPQFLRPMIGKAPPGGHYLNVYAADLARSPDGEWRVLADHTRSPAGAGYALENRLAVAELFAGLAERINIARLAPFFADLRAGFAAACPRSEPRIGLLSPGRFSQSYAEQAHLARYLGLILVEGADLAVHHGKAYLRTIEGLKRIDALWQRMDARYIDPLSLDPRSTIGVPGLVDAIAAGGVVVANAPGASVLESPAFLAFMPALAQKLLGEALRLPNIATWWCGQPRECRAVTTDFDRLVIGPAFADPPLGLAGQAARLGSEIIGPDREGLFADLARRPLDYVGQELVQLSTMPVVDQGQLVARPFTLRVFAARDAAGEWTVMPGGFARIGAVADVRAVSLGVGTRSADVRIRVDHPIEPITLLGTPGMDAIRRNPGTLPSRVADNLFWLGRYLERGEAVLALVRAGAAGVLVGDSASSVRAESLNRIRDRLVADFAAPHGSENILASALEDEYAPASVAASLATARAIGAGSRDRLSPDFWQLLDAPFPATGLFQQKNMVLKARFAALAGLAAEHMGRTSGWRFHDLGRRIERAIAGCRLIRDFAGEQASAEDLTVLLELCDVQITYRQRYPAGLALLPVRDMVGLDPFNPRSIAWQLTRISRHLELLPRLKDDGMAEPQQRMAAMLEARLAMLDAQSLTPPVCVELEARLSELSDTIAHRFFLHGSEALRASSMTLA